MANPFSKLSWIILICLVWVTAVSCTTTPLPTPVPIEPLTTARATATVATTSTPIILPINPTTTSIPTELPFASPTPKPTSSRPPTLTPLPTIAPDEAAIFVEELLETNSGCQFPCWWGIIPGETRWIDAKNFLDTFAIDYAVTGFGGGRSAYEVYVPSAYSERHISYTFYVLDNVVYGVGTGIGGLTWRNYELHQILNSFGPPKEVWIETFWREYHPFRVILFYPHLGIMVLYANDGSTSGDNIVGCPQDTDEFPEMSSQQRLPWLWVFTPDEGTTFVETADFIAETMGADNYLALEEATDMDVETFYETFKEASTTTCLITPSELW
jgi:hypothetical protein